MTTTYADSVILNVSGNNVLTAGLDVPIRVNVTGTSTYAFLFDKDDNALTNPFNADKNGNYLFKVADGRYDIIINEGQPSERLIPNILIGESEFLVKSYNTQSEAVSQADLKVGERVTIKQPLNTTGQKNYNVVAANTGTGDGFIDLANGLQLQEQLSSVETIADLQAISISGESVFLPPAQPDANGNQDSIADHTNWTPDEYITNLWEVLRAEFPSEITRALQGKDQSGVFDIWRYTFEPANATKTMIIICNIHGFERISQTGTYLFLRHVYKDWKLYPQLSHLRHNVRFVVIPIVNPWGLNESPSSRYNVNGVDLNRNFDYRWSDWNDTIDGQPKGSAAFSEVETQYVRQLLIDYPDAIAFFDMHDLNGPGDADYTAYGPWPQLNGKFQNLAQEAFDDVKDANETSLIFYTQAPSSFNYATDTYGMLSGNPEAETDGSGTDRWTSAAMTKAVKFWSNIFIKASREKKLATFNNDPFLRHASWTVNGGDASPIITTNTYTKIDGFTITERIRGSGYFIFSGTVSGTIGGILSGEKARVFVCPSIGHGQNPLVVFSEARTDLWESFMEGEQADRMTLDFEAVVPVSGDFVPVNIANLFKAGINMKIEDSTGSGATFTVSRYYANLRFMPSNNSNKFKWLRANGNLASGEGAMTEVDIY